MIDIGGAFNVSATYPQSTSNSADGSAMGFAFPFHAGIIFDGATITSRSVIVSGIFNLSFVNTGAGVIFASTNSSTCNNLIVSGQFYINVNHSSTSSACFAGGVDFSGIS
jgi:hypothetical protein